MFYMHYYEFLNGLIKLKLLVFCKHSVFNGFIIIEDLLELHNFLDMPYLGNGLR